MAAFLCYSIIPTGNIQAQEEGKLNITITQVKKTTRYLYGDKNIIDTQTPYEGEGLRAGLIEVIIKMALDNETDGDVVAPANQLFHVSFTDPYGRVPFQKESNEIIELFEKLMVMDFCDEYNSTTRELCRLSCNSPWMS